MVYSYLRVSTKEQDLEKFKDEVERYALYKGLEKPAYVMEKVSGRKVPLADRKLNNLLYKKDVTHIICPELSRLGRNTRENLEILHIARNRGITIHLIKENVEYNENPNPATILTLNILASLSQYEGDLISMRTKEALAYKKKQGVKLGRPKSTYVRTLDAHKDEIIELSEKENKTKEEIAALFNVSVRTLYRFLEDNKIKLKRKKRKKSRSRKYAYPRKDILNVDVI